MGCAGGRSCPANRWPGPREGGRIPVVLYTGGMLTLALTFGLLSLGIVIFVAQVITDLPAISRKPPKPDYLKIQALEWELGIEGAEEPGSVSRAKTVRAMSELVSQSYHELVRYDLPANQVVANCAICHRLRRSHSGFYPHEHMGNRPTPYEQPPAKATCIECGWSWAIGTEHHYHTVNDGPRTVRRS